MLERQLHLSQDPLFQHYDKLQRVANYLHSRHKISFRTVVVKNFKDECRLLRSIYNDAFQNHWGYVPFGEEEFLYMAKDMTQVLDPYLLFFVEVIIMVICGRIKPREGGQHFTESPKVDMTPWRYSWAACATMLTLIVAVYLLFSPIGLHDEIQLHRRQS